MRKELWCLVLLATLISSVNMPVYAAESCDSQVIASVGEHFNIKNFNSGDENGVIMAATCKTWPFKDNVVIAALAYAADPKEKSDMESKKGLLVLTMDNHSRTIISSYRDTIEEDAITSVQQDSFQLDTARYQLSKDVRAFGLRFRSGAPWPRGAEHTWDDQLTLFVPSGSELRPVFKYFMNVQRSLDGSIDAWESASLSISIEKTASNGYADLKISAVIEPGTDIDPRPATMNMKKRVESFVLHFDDSTYGTYTPVGNVPWWLDFQ